MSLAELSLARLALAELSLGTRVTGLHGRITEAAGHIGLRSRMLSGLGHRAGLAWAGTSARLANSPAKNGSIVKTPAKKAMSAAKKARYAPTLQYGTEVTSWTNA